ncbi:MAG: TlpA disulfide reductase family protein [Methylococcaceae bacterium]|jgi:thiol-disulfide isomerase/thioredoxin
MMKQWLSIVLVALLALTGGIAVKHFMAQSEISSLPAVSLPDLSGKSHDLSEWQGKIRVINFWATWCPPCRKEIPDFIALQQAYADKGVIVLGIAIDDQRAVSEFLQDIHINYPILMASDVGIALTRQLGNTLSVLPFTLIVDPQGKILHRHYGEFSKEKLIDIINPLLIPQ